MFTALPDLQSVLGRGVGVTTTRTAAAFVVDAQVDFAKRANTLDYKSQGLFSFMLQSFRHSQTLTIELAALGLSARTWVCRSGGYVTPKTCACSSPTTIQSFW
jgi:hypothetical protein